MDKANIIISIIIVLCIAAAVAAYGLTNTNNPIFSDLSSMGANNPSDNGLGNNTAVTNGSNTPATTTSSGSSTGSGSGSSGSSSSGSSSGTFQVQVEAQVQGPPNYHTQPQKRLLVMQ